jgi:hypothetical protein
LPATDIYRLAAIYDEFHAAGIVKIFVPFGIKTPAQKRQPSSVAYPGKRAKTFSFGSRRLAANGSGRLFVPNMQEFSPASGDPEKPSAVLRSLGTVS